MLKDGRQPKLSAVSMISTVEDDADQNLDCCVVRIPLSPASAKQLSVNRTYRNGTLFIWQAQFFAPLDLCDAPLMQRDLYRSILDLVDGSLYFMQHLLRCFMYGFTWHVKFCYVVRLRAL